MRLAHWGRFDELLSGTALVLMVLLPVVEMGLRAGSGLGASALTVRATFQVTAMSGVSSPQ